MSKNDSKGWRVVTYKDLDSSSKNEEDRVENFSEQQAQTPKAKSKPLIWGDLSAKPYWQRNLFPVLLEAAFLIFCFNVPVNYIIFVHFFFYLALFIFFFITKSFTFRNLWRNISSGIHFWRATIVCTILYAVFFYIIAGIQHFIPSLDLGFYPLKITSGLSLFTFIVTTMFLAPLVEETFFRGNLISMESKRLMAITSIISILLFAISHSYTIWGILSVALWALPLTLVFLKTRNFYVTMVAHFIVNVIGTLPMIINYFN